MSGLRDARPGGSTRTSRAPLRQTRGGRSAGARVPPVDYRDELRQCQPVHHLPEHSSTISPAFTHCGRGWTEPEGLGG